MEELAEGEADARSSVMTSCWRFASARPNSSRICGSAGSMTSIESAVSAIRVAIIADELRETRHGGARTRGRSAYR